MKINEITQNNKLIAEFMGLSKQHLDSDNKYPVYENPYTGEYQESIELSYEESWDWLMSVVEKIERLSFNVEIKSINQHVNSKDQINQFCNISHKYKDSLHFSRLNVSKIQSVYQTVIEFIEWHNENKKEA